MHNTTVLIVWLACSRIEINPETIRLEKLLSSLQIEALIVIRFYDATITNN